MAGIGIAPHDLLADRRLMRLGLRLLRRSHVGLVERLADLAADKGANQRAGGRCSDAARTVAELRAGDGAADAAQHRADIRLVRALAVLAGAERQDRYEDDCNALKSHRTTLTPCGHTRRGPSFCLDP